MSYYKMENKTLNFNLCKIIIEHKLQKTVDAYYKIFFTKYLLLKKL